MSIDWTTALCGAAVGYYAKTKVEDVKSETKKAISDTAAAAAVAAAQAINGEPAPKGQSGQKAGR